MTEESYQQCRKVMVSANYIRGLITKAEKNVGRWTKLEDANRRALKIPLADANKKLIEKAIIRLAELRSKFAAMKFPESDLPTDPKATKCKECGRKILYGQIHCDECAKIPVEQLNNQ